MNFFGHLSRNLRYIVPRKCFPHLAQARNIQRWVSPTLRELQTRKKRVGPLPLQPRTTYLEWNYDAEIYAFAKRLGERFNDDLLRQAFIHRSHIVQLELKGEEVNLQDNRELVHQGNLFLIEYIERKYGKYPKEVTTALIEYLTSNDMLAHVAAHMGVKDLVLSSDFPAEKVTLANTFKALLAALKQSEGNERVEKFIDDFLICQLNGKDIYDVWNLNNPYEYLLNLAQEKGYKEIEPRICNQSAVNTILANYQIGLYSDKKLLGLGWGESIELAKNTAALNAIQRLYDIKEF